MNQDNMLRNITYFCELEEKDYLKFLHRIGERNTRDYFGKVPMEWENAILFQEKYGRVTNKIYLSLFSYCLSALKFLQDNSVLGSDETGVLLKNRNKLTKFIDILEDYIFIDNVTQVYNERWFNKIIYNEMELAIKADTSITLILLQLNYMNKTAFTMDLEQENQIYLENTKNIAAIVKNILEDGKDELFHMDANEFLIVSKTAEHSYISEKMNSIIQEVTESIQDVYLYFGMTTITRGQLLEDFNIITYLKRADQDLRQNKQKINLLLRAFSGAIC